MYYSTSVLEVALREREIKLVAGIEMFKWNLDATNLLQKHAEFIGPCCVTHCTVWLGCHSAQKQQLLSSKTTLEKHTYRCQSVRANKEKTHNSSCVDVLALAAGNAHLAEELEKKSWCSSEDPQITPPSNLIWRDRRPRIQWTRDDCSKPLTTGLENRYWIHFPESGTQGVWQAVFRITP